MVKETNALGHVTEYSYSLGGKLTSVLDAMGNRTEYGYDKAGRLITVYRHEGDKELLKSIKSNKYHKEEKLEPQNLLRITRYKRDLMGNIVSITNAYGEEETLDRKSVV